MNFSFGSNTPKTTASTTGTMGTLGTSGGGIFGSSTTGTTAFQLSGAGDSKTGPALPTAAVKPAASAAPLSFTPTTTTAGSGFSGFGLAPTSTASGFAGFGLTSQSSTTTATSAPAQTQVASAPSFSFGGASTTSTAAPLSFSLTPSTTVAKPTTTVSSGATTLTSSASTAAPTAANITFVQLEETINKWTHELEEQEKIFMSQAAQINNWDNLLNSNSEKIVTLNNEVADMKLHQQQLDHELDFILAQQRELEEVLAPLEKQIAEVPSNTDPEREHTYYMAETLDTQLKQMSEDLREIIEHLNESSRTQDTSDPIVQIGRILNAHMNSLHWIDQMTMNIQNQLENVTRLHDAHRRENERSFRISYE